MTINYMQLVVVLCGYIGLCLILHVARMTADKLARKLQLKADTLDTIDVVFNITATVSKAIFLIAAVVLTFLNPVTLNKKQVDVGSAFSDAEVSTATVPTQEEIDAVNAKNNPNVFKQLATEEKNSQEAYEEFLRRQSK